MTYNCLTPLEFQVLVHTYFTDSYKHYVLTDMKEHNITKHSVINDEAVNNLYFLKMLVRREILPEGNYLIQPYNY